MKRIENPVRFLMDNGILFEVNRQVLHPLGLQLDIEVDEEGRVTSLELLDNRDSPEPIFFNADQFEEGRAKYEKYMQDQGKRNVQKRRQLGMVIQTGPNLPHHLHED